MKGYEGKEGDEGSITVFFITGLQVLIQQRKSPTTRGKILLKLCGSRAGMRVKVHRIYAKEKG